MPVTDDEILWAFRIILEREPDASALDRLRNLPSITRLRESLLGSKEFLRRFPDPLRGTDERRVVLADIAGTLRLYVDLVDRTVATSIVLGQYGRSEENLLRRFVKPGSKVIDIWADSGYFTVLLASLVGPHGRVYSFEPLKERADLVKRSVHENGFNDRVHLERLLVGNGSGNLRLASVPARERSIETPSVRILRFAEDSVPPDHNCVPVTMIGLDDHHFDGPVDAVVIGDCGLESLIISGAQHLLAHSKPIVLLQHDAAALTATSGHSLADVVAEMSRFGYRSFHVAAGFIAPLDAKPRRRTTAFFVPDYLVKDSVSHFQGLVNDPHLTLAR